jgi:hypothetical protein
LAATILFFTPFSLYIENITSYQSSAIVVGFSLLFLAMLGTIVVCLLFWWTPRFWIKASTGTFLLLAVAFWLQAALPADSQFFTGKNFDIGAKSNLYRDAALWIGIGVAGVFLRKFIAGNPIKIATIIIGAQVFSQVLAPLVDNRLLIMDYKGPSVTNLAQLYNFSRQKNIVVFIVDSLQNDVMADVMAENPALQKKVDGFKAYSDVTAMYNSTHLALPGLFLGEYFKNGGPVRPYYEKAFLSADSMLKMAEAAGYEVSFESFAPLRVIGSDSGARRHNGDSYWNVFRSLYQLSAFVLTPQYLKQDLLVRTHMLQSNPYLGMNREFVRRVQTRLTVDSAKPSFHVYHVPGVHAPFVIEDGGENGNRRMLGWSYPEYKLFSRLVLAELLDIFDAFKMAGVYDNTAIFLLGDHGVPCEKAADNPAPHLQPALWVKPFYSSGAPQTISRELSLADLKMGVVAAMGSNPPAEDYFRALPTTGRDRFVSVFEHYDMMRNFDRSGIKLLNYLVRGESRLRKSWSFIGQDTPKSMPLAMEQPSFGQKIPARWLDQFPSAGFALRGQWGLVEEKGVWTVGERAALIVPRPVGYSDGDLEIAISGEVYVGNKPQQNIRVTVNGTRLQNWWFHPDMRGVPSIIVPAAIVAQRDDLEIEFFIVEPRSPRENGQDPIDGRRLGLFVTEIAVGQPEKIDFGRTLNFVAQSVDIKYLSDGWGAPEKKGTWTEGGKALLRLPAPAGRSNGVVLKVDGESIVVSGRKQEIAVSVNGTPLTTWVLSAQSPAPSPLVIPASILAGKGNLEIQLDIKNPASLRQIGLDAGDVRQLGLFLRSITVQSKI